MTAYIVDTMLHCYVFLFILSFLKKQIENRSHIVLLFYFNLGVDVNLKNFEEGSNLNPRRGGDFERPQTPSYVFVLTALAHPPD